VLFLKVSYCVCCKHLVTLLFKFNFVICAFLLSVVLLILMLQLLIPFMPHLLHLNSVAFISSPMHIWNHNQAQVSSPFSAFGLSSPPPFLSLSLLRSTPLTKHHSPLFCTGRPPGIGIEASA